MHERRNYTWFIGRELACMHGRHAGHSKQCVTDPPLSWNDRIAVFIIVIVHVIAMYDVTSFPCTCTWYMWLSCIYVFNAQPLTQGFNYSHSNDKKQSAGGFNGVSLCCSVTAIFSYVVTVVCLILYFSLATGIGRRGIINTGICQSCSTECTNNVCQSVCTYQCWAPNNV